MPLTAANVTRWDRLTDHEARVISAALKRSMDDTLEAAREDAIPEDVLEDAVGTLLTMADLSISIDTRLGDNPPPPEVFAITASLILEGEYGNYLRAMQGGQLAEGPVAIDPADLAETVDIQPEDIGL